MFSTRSTPWFAALLLLVTPDAVLAGEQTRPLGDAMATRLFASHGGSGPRVAPAESSGDSIGCTNFERPLMRQFGYRGHAFFCDNFSTREVRGAVLNKRGFAVCDVLGTYDPIEDCYDITICDDPDRYCRRP